MFAIVGQSSSFHTTHHGYSEHLAFPPGLAYAQVALTIVDTDADADASHQSYAEAYIKAYTHRPIPDGADELVDAVFAPVISATERLTSVTWAIGADAAVVQARLDVFWWAEVSAAVKPALPFSVPPGLAAAVYDATSGNIHHIHVEVALLDPRRPTRRRWSDEGSSSRTSSLPASTSTTRGRSWCRVHGSGRRWAATPRTRDAPGGCAWTSTGASSSRLTAANAQIVRRWTRPPPAPSSGRPPTTQPGSSRAGRSPERSAPSVDKLHAAAQSLGACTDPGARAGGTGRDGLQPRRPSRTRTPRTQPHRGNWPCRDPSNMR